MSSEDVIFVPERWKPIEEFKARRPGGRFKYEVSDFGRVRSTCYFDRDNDFHPYTYLKCESNSSGHRYVTLVDNSGSAQKFAVCGLVAKAFVERVGSYKYVIHRNGKPDDDMARNLAWADSGVLIIKEEKLVVETPVSRRTESAVEERASAVKTVEAMVGKESLDSTDESAVASGEIAVSSSDSGALVRADVKKRKRAGQRVRQYTPDGKFIAEYPSAREGSQAIGKSISSNILYCCRRKPSFKTCGGYIWRFPEDDEFFLKD